METENKKYHVIISDESVQMLISHARFLTQVSEKAANRLIEDFEEKANSLKCYPERNPVIADSMIPAGKYRKMLIEKRYLLIYQIKDDYVYIDAIVDTRQDYSWLL